MCHGLVCEFVHEGGEEVETAVEDVEGSSGPVVGAERWGVVVEFGVQVQLVLYEAREVGAEDAAFVGRGSGAVVADCGVFA